MQGNSTGIGDVVPGVPLRHPVDIGRTATGTDQRFVVAVRRDQRQCFGCPVLLDSSASHRSRPSGEEDAHEPSLIGIYRVPATFGKSTGKG
jgi:hypothetical protein